MIAFELPLPPSQNNSKWVFKGRIVQKDNCRKWKQDADLLLKHIKPVDPCEWAFCLHFVFHYVKTPRRKDGDNFIKPIRDALAKRLGVDDTNVKLFSAFREFRKGRKEDFVTGYLSLCTPTDLGLFLDTLLNDLRKGCGLPDTLQAVPCTNWHHEAKLYSAHSLKRDK